MSEMKRSGTIVTLKMSVAVVYAGIAKAMVSTEPLRKLTEVISNSVALMKLSMSTLGKPKGSTLLI